MMTFFAYFAGNGSHEFHHQTGVMSAYSEINFALAA